MFLRIVLYCSLIILGRCLSTPFGKTTRNIATQVLQGAGPASVDLNKYNLPLEKIEGEWCAAFVQKSIDNEEGVYLGAKSDREIFVDSVLISFPRLAEGGLGIELTELAGGRDDGLGITVVTALVKGGSAENSGIIPGDSITEVSLIRRKSQSGKQLIEQQQEWSVRTECFSYDATVDSILSLPPAKADFEDFFSLKLKRLRRKPKVKVVLQYPPEQNEPDMIIEMNAGENLRQGMLVRGVKLNDPLAKRFDTKSGGNCGAGGLCRTCSVCVMNGGDLLNDQRVAEKQMLADNPRWRLACKAIIGFGMKEGEMTVRVNPNQW
jgi:ferredoxin